MICSYSRMNFFFLNRVKSPWVSPVMNIAICSLPIPILPHFLLDYHINISDFDQDGFGVLDCDFLYKFTSNGVIVVREAQGLILQPVLHFLLSGCLEGLLCSVLFKSLYLLQEVLLFA